MPSRTGTQATVQSSANSGSASVTVPADCTGIAVFFSGWQSSVASLTLTSMSIGGAPITIDQNLVSSGDAACIGVGHIINPATGNQTFSWDWSGSSSVSQGGTFHLVFLKDVNVADPISDHDAITSATNGPLTISVTLSTETTDYCVGAIFSWTNTPEGAPVGSDQSVFLNNNLWSQYYSDLFEEVSADSPSTVMSGTGRYPSLAAISWKLAPVVVDDPLPARRRSNFLVKNPFVSLMNFARTKLAWLELSDLEPSIPACSAILPASSARISHARIIKGERSPSQAWNFHETMKEAL